MYSGKVFSYHFICNYVILELIIVLEESGVRISVRGTNNVIVLYRTATARLFAIALSTPQFMFDLHFVNEGRRDFEEPFLRFGERFSRFSEAGDLVLLGPYHQLYSSSQDRLGNSVRSSLCFVSCFFPWLLDSAYVEIWKALH